MNSVCWKKEFLIRNVTIKYIFYYFLSIRSLLDALKRLTFQVGWVGGNFNVPNCSIQNRADTVPVALNKLAEFWLKKSAMKSSHIISKVRLMAHKNRLGVTLICLYLHR